MGGNNLSLISTDSQPPPPISMEVDDGTSSTSSLMSDLTIYPQSSASSFTPSPSEAGSSNFGINTNISKPIPFQRAGSSRYFSSRQVSTFQCHVCKRGFTKDSHPEHRLSSQNSNKLGPSELPNLPTTQNSGIHWLTNKFESLWKPKRKSVDEELAHFNQLLIGDSSGEICEEPANDDSFVCPNCPYKPTSYNEPAFLKHREVHPLHFEDESDEPIELPPCNSDILASSFIDKIQIGDPQQQLVTPEENMGHRNPFCKIHQNPNSSQTNYTITHKARENKQPTGDDSRPSRTSPKPSTSRQGPSRTSPRPSTSAEVPSANVNLPKASTSTIPTDESEDEASEEELVIHPVLVRDSYMGVEIVKGTSSIDPSKVFRQCSRCKFSLPCVKTDRNGGNTSLKQLQHHIRSLHKRQLAVVQTQQISSHLVQKTGVRMGSKLAPDCEICGYPFATGTRINRIKHAFSHMSEKERNAAIAKGKGKIMFKKFNKYGGSTTCKKSQKTGTIVSEIAGKYACTICRHKFSGNIALSNHMRMHTGKSNAGRRVRKERACTFCERVFVGGIALSNHMRVCKKNTGIGASGQAI